MKIPYLLLATTLTLAACGSDTDTSSQSATSQSTSHAKMEAPVTPVQQVTKTKHSLNEQAEKKDVIEAEDKKFELPLGRLTGIIDTGEYKQAIINNQDQIIRLKEGDNWQGWTVITIHPEKIAINHKGEEHSLLLLSEFRSPQLTQTELENKATQNADQNNAAQEATAEPSTPPFTEEQLTELRSRLLIGR